MTCPQHLGGCTDGLACMRTDPHQVGHVYVSTSGVPDAAKEE